LVISSSKAEDVNPELAHFGVPMRTGKDAVVTGAAVTTAHAGHEGSLDTTPGDAIGMEATEWVGSVDQPHARGRNLDLLGRFCDLKPAERV
jgi:hypothetical protein